MHGLCIFRFVNGHDPARYIVAIEIELEEFKRLADDMIAVPTWESGTYLNAC